MEFKDDREIILEQYKIYSDAKERFIDRHFSSNRFYLVLNIIILITVYILSTLTPQLSPVIILCIAGLAVTILWFMSIDTYQVLIKIKYAKVLEYLETKLPEQPFNKEFVEYKQLKKNKNLIVFPDFQKAFTLAIICVYVVVLLYNIANLIKYNIMI